MELFSVRRTLGNSVQVSLTAKRLRPRAQGCRALAATLEINGSQGFNLEEVATVAVLLGSIRAPGVGAIPLGLDHLVLAFPG